MTVEEVATWTATMGPLAVKVVAGGDHIGLHCFPSFFSPMTSSTRSRASQVTTTKVDPKELPNLTATDKPTGKISSADEQQAKQDDLVAKLAEMENKLKAAQEAAAAAEAKAGLLQLRSDKKKSKSQAKTIAFSHPMLEQTITFTPKDSKKTRNKSYFYSVFENLRYPIRWAIDKVKESPNDPEAIQVANVINNMILECIPLITNNNTRDMLEHKWKEGEHMVHSSQAKLFRNVSQFAGNYCLIYIAFVDAFKGHIEPSNEVVKAINDIRKQYTVLKGAKEEEERSIKDAAKALGITEESVEESVE